MNNGDSRGGKIIISESDDVIPLLDFHLLVTVVEMPEEIDSVHGLKLLELVIPKLLGNVGPLELLLEQPVPVETLEKLVLLDALKSEFCPLLDVFGQQLRYQLFGLLVFHEFRERQVRLLY